MIPKRYCTTCNANGDRDVEAKVVAADRDGLEWFECGKHGERENAARVKRVSLTPIDDWFRKHGLAN